MGKPAIWLGWVNNMVRSLSSINEMKELQLWYQYWCCISLRHWYSRCKIQSAGTKIAGCILRVASTPCVHQLPRSKEVANKGLILAYWFALQRMRMPSKPGCLLAAEALGPGSSNGSLPVLPCLASEWAMTLPEESSNLCDCFCWKWLDIAG